MESEAVVNIYGKSVEANTAPLSEYNFVLTVGNYL